MPGFNTSAALAYQQVESSATFPKLGPSGHLSTAEKRIWRILVQSMSHLEFSELDRPLLERYCAITMLLRKTMRHIRAKSTKKDGRPNPWLKIHERQLSLLHSVSHQLQTRPILRQCQRQRIIDTRDLVSTSTPSM